MTRLIQITDRLLLGVALLALLGLVGVTATDVVGRTFFDAPLGFAYELVGVLLGIAVYGGLVSTNFLREHIQIDLLEDVFARRPRFDRLRGGVVWALEAVFFGLLAVFLVYQTLELARWGETFYFLPLEKWQPLVVMSALGLLAALAYPVGLLLRPTTSSSVGRPSEADGAAPSVTPDGVDR